MLNFIACVLFDDFQILQKPLLRNGNRLKKLSFSQSHLASTRLFPDLYQRVPFPHAFHMRLKGIPFQFIRNVPEAHSIWESEEILGHSSIYAPRAVIPSTGFFKSRQLASLEYPQQWAPYSFLKQPISVLKCPTYHRPPHQYLVSANLHR